MELEFRAFDGEQPSFLPIINKDTGEQVGEIYCQGSVEGGGINVSIFNGKYRGTVNTYEECVGFVKGVETVLTHILPSRTKLATNAS
jgi:hypothetical protein